MKLTTVFNMVKGLLEDFESLRNNDEALVCRIWAEDLRDMGLNIYKMSANDFFTMYQTGRINTADYILRARRKCNEEFPHTRGSSYKPRMKQQEIVKQEVKELSA